VVGTPNAMNKGIPRMNTESLGSTRRRILRGLSYSRRWQVGGEAQPEEVPAMDDDVASVASSAFVSFPPGLPAIALENARTMKAFKLRGAVRTGVNIYLRASTYVLNIWKREEATIFAGLPKTLILQCEDPLAKAQLDRLRKKLRCIVWRAHS
jgi:hypothetical protein